MSTLLDGKILAAVLKDSLSQDISELKRKYQTTPRIVSISFGKDAASQSYISSQQKTALALEIHYSLEVLDDKVSLKDALALIGELNEDKQVHGIIINKPVPEGLDFNALLNSISPLKDIEGMNQANLGKLWMNQSRLWPCTPAAALELLKTSKLPLAGKRAVVIGRSEILGKPMALLLLKEDMTVTITHSKTVDLPGILKDADVVVAAVGKPLFVKAEWIKPGAVVIDAGINYAQGKIVGDVDFESVKDRAGFISPVPGGVGPVTAMILMKNTVEAFKQQI